MPTSDQLLPDPERAAALLEEFVEECGSEDTILYDGWAHCVIGMGERFNSGPVLIYDRDAILATMMLRDGMTYDEAVEMFDFNVLGGWVGDSTPIFLSRRFPTPPSELLLDQAVALQPDDAADE